MSKAADYRKRRTVELTLPSGAVFTVQRPPLAVWIANGKLPQSLARQVAASAMGGVKPDLSADDTLDIMAFLRDAVIWSSVEPKIFPDTTVVADEELTVGELEPEDFEFLCQWVLTGARALPVAVKGGEVTQDGLEAFRAPERGPGFADVGTDGAEVRTAAVATAGAGG